MANGWQSKQTLNRRRSGPCTLCGIERRALHRDHIVPKALRGSDADDNIQYICANCHEDKTRGDLSAIRREWWAKQPESVRKEYGRRAGQASWDRATPDERSARASQSNRTRWANMPIKERAARTAELTIQLEHARSMRKKGNQ